MKKIIFSAIIIFCFADVASAQTTSAKTSSGSSNTRVSKKFTSSHKAKISRTPTSSTAASSKQIKKIPDNRKEYIQNGQLATYTGHQATPTNTDQFVGIKKKPVKKQKENSKLLRKVY